MKTLHTNFHHINIISRGAKQLTKKSIAFHNTLMSDTKAIIIASFTRIITVILITLNFTSCEPQKMTKLPGSIILQIQHTDSTGKETHDFYQITNDSLKGLLISKSIKSPFPQVNGPILAYSQNHKFVVFRLDSADIGSKFQLLNIESGKISTIESSPYIKQIDFRFSLDSRWLAYTNNYRIMVYDCSESRKFCLKEPLSATYFGINGLTYGFVGSIAWTASNNIYYQYCSKMPESYTTNNNNDPHNPDSYEISTPQGKRLVGGTLKSLDSAGILSPEKYPKEMKTLFLDEDCFIAGSFNTAANLTKQYIYYYNSMNSYEFRAPDNRHMIMIHDNINSNANWYWIDIQSKQKTLLGTTIGLRYSDNFNWFWSPDFSFLFLLYDSHTIYAVPISKDQPLMIDIDAALGMSSLHNQIIFGCYMN
jgi:hypothetical protein